MRKELIMSINLNSPTVNIRDTILVQTKYGDIKSNFGFELTEKGKLKSIEPMFGVMLKTECGKLYPFNSENYHLQAENNSLVFDDDGELSAAATLKSQLKVKTDNGIRYIEAQKAEDPLTGVYRLFPLSLTFDKEYLHVEHINGLKETFERENVTFI